MFIISNHGYSLVSFYGIQSLEPETKEKFKLANIRLLSLTYYRPIHNPMCVCSYLSPDYLTHALEGPHPSLTVLSSAPSILSALRTYLYFWFLVALQSIVRKTQAYP